MNSPYILNVLSAWSLPVLIPLVISTSFFLTVAALAFFIESALVLRALVLGRSRGVRYLLLGLPLGAAILSYIVAMHGWQMYYDLQHIYVGHVTFYVWNEILLLTQYNLFSAAIIGLLQSILAIVLFALSLFLEKKLLPRVKHPPLWTVVRRPRIV
ncbi:MAG: hypothetical protein ACRDIV_01970 [Ktedonobacteraceae bacterium]